eukprot:m.7939 g.7939  ORF g.7939 m.7939 type:complete len:757 (-) comp2967_c0_seq1:2258-4528(-)
MMALLNSGRLLLRIVFVGFMLSVMATLPPTIEIHALPVVGDRQLIARTFEPLNISNITPRGWLAEQLKIQSEGLSGHLALFWPDIKDSIWVGGSGDGGLNERTPYWLNGAVPLLKLLENMDAEERKLAAQSNDLCQQGVDMMNIDLDLIQVSSIQECHDACVNNTGCAAFVVDSCNATMNCWLKYGFGPTDQASCRCFGIPPKNSETFNLTAQVDRYINFILAHQQPNGWYGPDNDATGTMYWSKFPLIMALQHYMEFHPETMSTIVPSVVRFYKECSNRMQKTPMSDWAAARGYDFALTVEWVLKHYPNGEDSFLWQFMDQVRSQTWDWETWFQAFQTGANTHGVNNAQALKSSGVWYVATGNESFYESSKERLRNIDDTYGLASGVFCADELLCDTPQQKMPSRGTELCTVVEAMFSYNTLFSVHGDVMFADRAERIAYNALPATWASPRGGDMWNHQYLQAENEINAASFAESIWTHDGPDAELYGLAPNYGCCTANFNQGWPKFARMLIFSTSDNGAAIGALAPVKALLPNNAEIIVDTNFPHSDVVIVNVTSPVAMPLYLRIPTWAKQAVTSINGKRFDGTNAGEMNKLDLPSGFSQIILNLNPQIRLEHWFSEGTFTVHRGALMYSLPITPNYTTLTTYAYESRDYQLLPTTEWRYAMGLNDTDPTASFAFVDNGYIPGAAPFNHTNFASVIKGRGRVVPWWGFDKNSAASPPPSPVCTPVGSEKCGEFVNLTLVPFGSTELRISEFPWA